MSGIDPSTGIDINDKPLEPKIYQGIRVHTDPARNDKRDSHPRSDPMREEYHRVLEYFHSNMLREAESHPSSYADGVLYGIQTCHRIFSNLSTHKAPKGGTS